MPAVARRVSPNSYDDQEVAAPRRLKAGAGPATRARVVAKTPQGKGSPARKRWHDSPRPQRDEQAEEDWRGLIDHFGGRETAQIAIDKKEIEARQHARRRARLKHRPFRMTLLATALAGAPLALLACLLWMRSSAFALMRHDDALHKQIVATRFELQSTRKEIAAVNASPQVEHWARERGWRQATQQDFDDLSNVAGAGRMALQPDAATPQGNQVP